MSNAPTIRTDRTMKTIALLVTLIASTTIADAGTRLPVDHDGQHDLDDLRGSKGKTQCRSSRPGTDGVHELPMTRRPL